MNKEKLFRIIKNTVAVIVMIALFVIIFYQNRDRDIFKFGRKESDSVIDNYTDFSGEQNHTNGQIGKIGKDVAYLTTRSVKFLDENAEGATLSLALSEPTLHTEGDYAVCYGKNSYEATVYKSNMECYTVAFNNRLIRAKVNKNGYLFTATEKEGYNCECVVYNRSGEAIFKWDISKSEFLDGDINNSNNAIAISVTTAGEQMLMGEVLLIDITDAEILCKNSFDSQVLFTVDFNRNDTFTALGNKNVVYFNADGTKKWSFDFEEKPLLKADLSEPDMMVIAFSDEGNGIKGNSTDVKVINRLGKIISEKSFDSVADDISVGENTIAIAFGKTVYLTDSELKIKKELKSDSSIKKIALYSDNEHLFVLGNSGGKILE